MLLPLCGASLDLAWLQRQGHTVVGVEGVRKVAEKLFKDANMSLRATEVASAIVTFSSVDACLTVLVPDFINISAEVISTFDAVIDRFFDRIFFAFLNTIKPILVLEASSTSSVVSGMTAVRGWGGPSSASCQGQGTFEGVGAVTILSHTDDEGPRQ